MIRIVCKCLGVLGCVLTKTKKELIEFLRFAYFRGFAWLVLGIDRVSDRETNYLTERQKGSGCDSLLAVSVRECKTRTSEVLTQLVLGSVCEWLGSDRECSGDKLLD